MRWLGLVRPYTEMLARIANVLTLWAQRWVPDAYVIAILLTAIVFVLALSAGAAPIQVVEAWGGGFWELLPFAMQMCLIMLGGYILAQTRPVATILDALAKRATTPTRAILTVSLFSMLSALINWGLSISASAVCAIAVARRCPKADFRLLIACAYLGMSTTWHAGLSASAPLLVATKEHSDRTGIPAIPVSETIFTPFNMILTLIVVVVVAALMPRLQPKPKDVVSFTDSGVAEVEEEAPSESRPWSELLERTPFVTLFIIAMAGVFLWTHFTSKPIGSAIDINTVNFILLMSAILLHWTPANFLAACRKGGAFVWGIIIQFPFYAGIYGIIKSTQLQDWLANVFIRGTSEGGFPLVVYWYSGIVNYFVPSGGSKWFIEAPYIMKAGGELGVEPALTVLAYAWGDMMTDAIQPFWAIPLLGLAGLKFRDVMGYLTLVFLIYAGLVSIAFILAPRFF